jgi:cation diffusion facilitator family transporter
MSASASQIADKEKTAAALSSVIAAVGLTTFKIVVGVMTHSLGILAEAAHSGLDLVAALVTFLAVRISGKPPDSEHQYGHGKIENLSALFETVLLLVTCVWIIYEAIQRLFFKNVLVDISIWAFLVMGVSILVDFTRSRVLYKAARRHNSQALEADALHFSTDIWSSTVVILGLAGITLAENIPGLAFLKKADAVAALFVALIVVYVSFELGIRTVRGLLDQSPAGLADKIQQITNQVPGVLSSHNVRVRPAGPNLFVDLHIQVNPSIGITEAHAISKAVKLAVKGAVHATDVVVHTEPAEQAK